MVQHMAAPEPVTPPDQMSEADAEARLTQDRFDISAMVTLVADAPIEEEFIWTMRNVGIDHILIGSDYPQFSLKQTLDALDKLDLTPAEKAKIRPGNARELMGLKP